MLDRTNNERVCAGITEFEWLCLTTIERRLVGLYRQLTEQDRKQLRCLTETLAINPKEPAAS